MKTTFLLILLTVFYSCKEEQIKNQFNNDYKKETLIKAVVDSSEIVIENISKVIDNENRDCVFDQLTQTDEFLKGIKELEDYLWFHEEKKAEIVLNDHWNLTIKRGGCDHFEMSATFVYDRILDIENEKDKKQIFESVIWITSLLDDFDGEEIYEAIDNDKVMITKDKEFDYHANFMNEKLYELYYMELNNKDQTTFSIGYYYN